MPRGASAGSDKSDRAKVTSSLLFTSIEAGHGLSIGSLRLPRSLSLLGRVLGVSSLSGVKLPRRYGSVSMPALTSSSKSEHLLCARCRMT